MQKEAHGDLVELERQQKSGRLKDGAQQKLSHYVQHWLERARRVKKWRTYQTYEGDLRNHVLPYLGHKRLDKISRADVQQMVDAAFDRATAQEQSGAAVARKARAVLRTALQDAVDLELLERNPCERIKVPAEPVSQIEVWTPSEARRFLDSAKSHRLYPLLYTAIRTGMRQGELLMLQWEELHLDDELPFVEIKRTLVLVKYSNIPQARRNQKLTQFYKNFFYNAPKTKGSQGIVSLPADTVRILKAQKENLTQEAARIGRRWTELGLVFPSNVGTPMSPNSLLTATNVSSRRPTSQRSRFTTCGTATLVSCSPKVWTSARYPSALRHTTKSTTLNRYVHVVEAQRRRATMTMDELFGFQNER